VVKKAPFYGGNVKRGNLHDGGEPAPDGEAGSRRARCYFTRRTVIGYVYS
jgi:hypothetical protein